MRAPKKAACNNTASHSSNIPSTSKPPKKNARKVKLPVAGSGSPATTPAPATATLSSLEKLAGVDPNSPLPCITPTECPDHHPQGSNGFPVVPATIKQIGAKLKLLSDFDAIQAKLTGQIHTVPRLALTAVVTTLALMAKLKLVPATQFSDQRQASKVYGQLKYAAIKGDVATIKKLIPDTKGLSDNELIMLWGHNEHNDLHSAFTTKPPLFQAAHITSLNSFLKEMETMTHHSANEPAKMVLVPPTPNVADFPAGGANSKGWGYEPGWFEAAKSVAGFLG